MEIPKKTLLDQLYEECEIKSNIMTKEEFDKIPLNDKYIANQKKKEEETEKLKSDTK
jgi:hypothetical protein